MIIVFCKDYFIYIIVISR